MPVLGVPRRIRVRQRFISMQFYETYYYANIVHNVLTDPFPYIRSVHAWYEDREAEVLLPPFPKWTRLHDFTRYVINSVIDEDVRDTTIDAVVHETGFEVWADQALRQHKYECIGFKRWLKEQAISLDDLTEDHLADYYSELRLSGSLEDLVEHISEEVFHVLFGNRVLLSQLNHMLARVLKTTFSDCIPEEAAAHFDAPGKLTRVPLPEWCKRAIFHRDRGMCAACNKDISGLVAAQPDKHYDHIAALSLGGLNDVTNIQLLCEACNLKKSAKSAPVSDLYESWY